MVALLKNKTFYKSLPSLFSSLYDSIDNQFLLCTGYNVYGTFSTWHRLFR